jgi:hypothetical protein
MRSREVTENRPAADRAADASDLRAAVERALAARERLIAGATNERLTRVLSAAAHAWLGDVAAADGRRAARRGAVVAELAERSSVHPDLLSYGLDLVLSAIHENAIAQLLTEAHPPAALERAVERPDGSGRARLLGPVGVLHSLAGNVPALALPAIVAGVLARSVTLVRDSVRQPALTEAFVATLTELDADVGATVVPLRWPAGDVAREREALALVERAELWGSSATVAAIRGRHARALTEHVETVERGTRWSAGLITAAVEPERWADGFALDVVLHDGLGCLTPDAIFVAGGRERAKRFAVALAAALAALEERWPRRPRGFDVEAQRRAFVDRCEAHALAGGGAVLRGRHDAWVVAQTSQWDVTAGPGLRCVRVVACDNDAEALSAFVRPPAPLAAVGLADDTQQDGRTDAEGGGNADGAGRRSSPGRSDACAGSLNATLPARLAALGATLVCAPGRMQAPPLVWAQDGRRRLGDLLSWHPVDGPGSSVPDAPK